MSISFLAMFCLNWIFTTNNQLFTELDTEMVYLNIMNLKKSYPNFEEIKLSYGYVTVTCALYFKKLR